MNCRRCTYLGAYGSPKKEEYVRAVREYYQKASIPTCEDYYVDDKNYIRPYVPESI